MKNLEISKRLATARCGLQGSEQYGLREECRRYANLLIEARPGRFVRAEAIALLKRVGGSIRA